MHIGVTAIIKGRWSLICSFFPSQRTFQCWSWYYIYILYILYTISINSAFRNSNFTPFDAKCIFKTFFPAPTHPGESLSPHESAAGGGKNPKVAWNEKKEKREYLICHVCRGGRQLPLTPPPHEPPFTGDNEANSASILARAAGPVALSSCDRRVHSACHRWDGEKKGKTTSVLPPTTLSACLSPCI